MNFLAHLYLSGSNEELLVGNFIGDYVKGNKYNNYPATIKAGILLHRQIDYYTDTHPMFRKSKKLLVPEYGLYSGIVMDLFSDHFLAINWQKYSELTLRQFAKRAHAILLSNYFQLPSRVQGFLPFLIQHKRLESYARKDGIQKSLEIMSRYTSLPEKSEKAMEIMVGNFEIFDQNFALFMEDMIEFIEGTQKVPIKKPDLSTGF
jgi:acyl carrier protein phosphodiesterase